MAVTPDGQTIVMRETHNGHVTSFPIDEDGGLFDKKTFASGLHLPDGFCLDAAGAVWIGCLFASEFLRITEGGTITHRVRVPAPYWALAPMLGGPDRHTLYLLAAGCRSRTCSAARLPRIPVPRASRCAGRGLPVNSGT